MWRCDLTGPDGDSWDWGDARPPSHGNVVSRARRSTSASSSRNAATSPTRASTLSATRPPEWMGDCSGFRRRCAASVGEPAQCTLSEISDQLEDLGGGVAERLAEAGQPVA